VLSAWRLFSVFALSSGCIAVPATAQDLDVTELKRRLASFDVNEDGSLSGTELDNCRCRGFDLDRDNEVSLAEFTAGVIMGGGGAAMNPADPRRANPARQDPIPRPPPPVEARAGASIPVGRYSCHYMRYMNVVPAGNMISILSPGEYRWYDSGSGKFSVDASGRLTWLSGPLAGSGIVGNYYNRQSDGKPTVKLVLKGVGAGSSTQTNYCILH
jgi:hypothetical protein